METETEMDAAQVQQLTAWLLRQLHAVYGAGWERSVGSVDEGDVVAVWACAVEDIAMTSRDVAGKMSWVLRHRLPERAPNAIVFKRLCADAGQDAEYIKTLPKQQALAAPKGTPIDQLSPEAKEARERLRELTKRMVSEHGLRRVA